MREIARDENRERGRVAGKRGPGGSVRERPNGEGEKSGRSDPIFRWLSWVTLARPGNAGDATSDEPMAKTQPQPASQTRRIQEKPCDPNLPEVRSSMSGCQTPISGGLRRLSG
jgi:hypothetical protein